MCIIYLLFFADINIKRYLALCKTAIAKQDEQTKRQYKGMFDKMAEMEMGEDNNKHPESTAADDEPMER